MEGGDGHFALRILTHNIRYATTNPDAGEEPWHIRCPRLCAELVYNSLNPDTSFICLQEVIHEQLQDILKALNPSDGTDPSWTHIGVGRDNGKQAGEYSPILYRPEVWELKNWENLWLSEHPDRPGKGWDAASIRIITIGVFSHRSTGRKVVIMDTHLDDQGRISRAESAKMILKLVERFTMSQYSESPLPCFLAGDFNSPPDDEAYQIMVSKDSNMVDVSGCISHSNQYGHQMTYTSFREEGSTPSRIDFIFCSKSSECTIKSFAVLSNVFDDGIYLSDHRAVVTDLMI